jgi:general secretion pathway protein I
MSPPDRTAPPDAGFTLIEALVAMAVLAAGAVTLLAAAERHAGIARGLGDRTVASWLAEDRLTGIALGLPGSETVDALGGVWRVETQLAPTADPELLRADVTVRAEAGGGAVTLTGFVDARALPQGTRP